MAPTNSEWIDVEQEMPTEEEYVLINISGQVVEGWWSSSYRSKWRATRRPSMPTPKPVTHWKPLDAPPAPKESTHV